MSLQDSAIAKYDGFGVLDRGMDSGHAPSNIDLNQAALLVNAQTRDGYTRNRPGLQKITLTGDSFQLGRWQMASPFITASGTPYLIASIGGHIVRFDPISGSVLDLSTTADLQNPDNRERAWFCQAETFLCIQDNSSIPLIFDGAVLRRGRPVSFGGDEFPVGNAMEYNNGRLWVALPDYRTFVGGDLAYSDTGLASDVLKSTQNSFLTTGSFALPATAGFITSMHSVSNQDSVLGQGPLIVFGQYGAAAVNAPFNADAWQNTDSPISTLSLLSPGPSGQDCCVNVNGDLWYRAPDGIRSFMIARRDHGTWVNTPLSYEMVRILERDDPYLLPFVSSVDFDNRQLTTCSPYRATEDAIPYGVAHRGLVVLDFMPTSSMFDRTNPVWQGIWNGLNILQILTLNCYGKDRCFLFVLNDCLEIELWELTKDTKFDNLTDEIEWKIQTRAFGFQDKAETLKKLLRPETWLQEVVGEVDYTIKYRPDAYPFWLPLDSGTFCATKGMCSPPNCTTPQAPFPQYRPRIIASAPNDDCEECVQKEFQNGFEFQFELTFNGAASLRRFRVVATDVPEDVANGCMADNSDEECCSETGCQTYPFEYVTPNEC